jgi:hypothetical protein
LMRQPAMEGDLAPPVGVTSTKVGLMMQITLFTPPRDKPQHIDASVGDHRGEAMSSEPGVAPP